MAYLKKTTAGTTQPENPQGSLVSQGGGALGSGGDTGGASQTSSTSPGLTERSPSTPQYVSGQQYLEGNRTGAQKLAEQIVNPIAQQGKDIEAAAKAKALQTINQAQLGGVDESLVTRAAADARALQEPETQQIKDLLAGKYSGPTGIDFSQEQNQVSNLDEKTALLGTSAGVEQELARMGNANDRKYTTGMKSFDAMLMRQDPTLRQKLEAQAGLGQRVGGTLEEQRQAALAGIAQGQAGAAQRGQDIGKYFGDVAAGQEASWTEALQQVRDIASGIPGALQNEKPLTKAQLDMIGLTPEAYDQMRDAYVATSYGRNRPLTYDENYNYNLNSPTQFTAPDAYVANAWENFQLDPYATGLNVNNIGYNNVVDAESLARYQALNQLRNAQGAGFVPQAAGVGNLTENAMNFNNVAAQQALAAFMQSGVKAPTSNLDVMEGQFGPGGYLGWGAGAPTTPRTPLYTTSGENIQTVNPLTGRDPDAMAYVGPKSSYGYALDPYNPAAYDYSGRNPVDQAMLDERALRSGAGQSWSPTQYQVDPYVAQLQALNAIQNG